MLIFYNNSLGSVKRVRKTIMREERREGGKKGERKKKERN